VEELDASDRETSVDFFMVLLWRYSGASASRGLLEMNLQQIEYSRHVGSNLTLLSSKASYGLVPDSSISID
jgi:hypothetical protein